MIRSTEYGEGNVIISLYTGEYGKVGVMVRGAKKSKSRHAAVTQLYTYGEYVYYKGNNSSLGTLNHADLINAYQRVRSELLSSAYAAYFAELVDRLVQDGEASAGIFHQLQAALEALNESKDPQVVAHLLEMKLFQHAGIAPVLNACVSCGREGHERESAAWSAALGGLLCDQCGFGALDRTAIPAAVLKCMRLFERTDLRRLGAVQLKPQTKKALKQVIRAWMDTHADIRFKSRAVLDQVEALYDS